MSGSDPLERARLLVELERWTEALVILRAYVSTSPDSAGVWCLIAQCQLGRDDADAAREAARQAVRAEPDSEWAHRLLSVSSAATGRYVWAREAADESVRLAPNLWMAHRQRAEVDIRASHITSGTWAAARRAIELAPNEAATHLTLGRVALAAKDNRRATAAFREVLRLDPGSAAARNNLAVVQLRRRRLASAGAHLIGALRLDPNSRVSAANLRVVLRVWATVLELLGIVGCLVVLGSTAGHSVTDPIPAYDLPTQFATLSPTQSITISATDLPARALSPSTHHVAATGRPLVLVIVAGVILLGLLGVAGAVRASIGPATRRIVAEAVRTDLVLAATVGACLVGVACVVAAAVTGLPTARGLVGFALILDVLVTVLLRFSRGTRRRRR